MMKSADRRVESPDVGGESSGMEYSGCAERVREARSAPHQAKREVDHELTDEHAISFRFDCTIEPVMIHTPEELDAAFPAMEKSRPDAIIVQPSLPIKRFPTMVGWRRSPSAEGRYSVAERQLGSPYVAA